MPTPTTPAEARYGVKGMSKIARTCSRTMNPMIEALHAVDEEADDAHEDEGDGKDDEQSRQVKMDEDQPVVTPVADDVGEGVLILRVNRQKEHDGDVSAGLR